MIEQDRRQTLKWLLAWALAIFFVLIAFWFLHEVAHGFGFQLDDIHVSTGFNVVGESGKKPSDADFNINLPVGGMSTGLILGPFTTWILAILFTGILLHRSIANSTTLIIGAAAVTNSLMRLIPMAIFFVAALAGNISGVFQDEAKMSLGAIEGITLPISSSELSRLLETQPEMFLSNPGFYFWPIVSAGISLVCIVLAYRHLFQVFGSRMQSRASKLVFGLIPFILFFIPVLGVVSALDNIIRINW
jgi:hypothetical protein